MLVTVARSVLAQSPDRTRSLLLNDAQDASYSPDGTLVAFARQGDLWLANADGSGERRLASTPRVEEWKPSWLPSGAAIVYTASQNGSRQIRVFRLPMGPSTRIAASSAQEYGATVSRQGRLAFVSTRSGVPSIYVAQATGAGVRAFDSTPPATPFADVHDLVW